MDYKRNINKIQKIRTGIKMETDYKKAHEMYPIVEWIDKCIDNNEFKKLNDTLMVLSMDLHESEYSIIMRVTYPWKGKLKDWMHALEKLLSGLYK